jgi:hypothetical protein
MATSKTQISKTQLKHEATAVRSIIKEFREGKLVVPEFQRDYVWRPSRAPKLIDSLYRNYPISSLLVWESTDLVEVRRQEPHRSLTGSLGWLVDGQQRVITLARTMSGDEGIEVVFNIDSEEFSRANAATVRTGTSWLRVADIWDDDWFFRYRRDLSDNSKDRDIERRLERLRKVLDYEIPIVRMIGGYSFDDAQEAFTRINSYGVRLKGEDLESARIAAKHSGFIRRQLIPFLHDLERRGFDRLSATHLFRVCAFIAHPDGRRRTPLHELDTHEVENAWRRTKTAVESALGLVASELGIADMSILWSGNLLVPVIALCGTVPPKERDDREIAGWVAAASLCHRYSRSSQSALDKDLRACRASDPVRSLLANLKQSRPYLYADPSDFEGAIADRSGMLATYIACKHLGARDLLTGRTIQARSKIDRHHILPRSLFPNGPERRRADVLANIAFVIKDANQSISDANPGVYLKSVEPAVRKSQAIPNNQSLWNVTRSEEFWVERQNILAKAFNDYLKSVFLRRRLIG